MTRTSDFESKKKENHQNFAGDPFLRFKLQIYRHNLTKILNKNQRISIPFSKIPYSKSLHKNFVSYTFGNMFCLTIHPDIQLYFGKEKISRKISIPPTNCTPPIGKVQIVTKQLCRYKLYPSSAGGTNCNKTVMSVQTVPIQCGRYKL